LPGPANGRGGGGGGKDGGTKAYESSCTPEFEFDGSVNELNDPTAPTAAADDDEGTICCCSCCSSCCRVLENDAAGRRVFGIACFYQTQRQAS